VTERELWSYTFRRSNLVELAGAAAAAGFDCVTTTTALYARSVGEHPDLCARVEDHGVRVTFIDGLATALPGTNLPPGEATLDECIEMAHAVGAGAINVVHMTGRSMPLAEMADAFTAACARAAAEELRLAIEFIPETGIPDFATAAAIVREAGASNGSVLLDTWHFARSGGDLATLDDDALSLVGGVQLSDRTPDQAAQPYVPRKGRKIPGDGSLPLARLTADLRRLHPELPIGVEVLSDEIDALGLDDGARRLAGSLDALLRD
jgi:sugar phosphate isomerase/epimerase